MCYALLRLTTRPGGSAAGPPTAAVRRREAGA
jgi:hypothetical protein